MIYVNARFLTQPITGTQRFAIELSRHLKKLMPELVFLSPKGIIHKEVAEELGVVTFGRLSSKLLWEQIELPLYLYKKKKAILLNLCNVAPVLYNKNIVTVLDLSFYLHPEWFSKQFSLLYNTIVPYISKRAVRVLTISENTKADLVKHFKIDASSIDIIYPSISDIFSNPEIVNSESRYGKYILSVSSLDPRKNFAGLIKAYLKADFNDVQLLIVGSANKVFSNEGFSTLINNDPRIVFTGYVTDEELVGLYKNAHLFAYVSFFEGFGIPPLEAMAAGCPTLVSNSTSMPEVCGDASYYVDPYDVESIENGLIEMVNDETLRAQFSRKGYEQLQKFQWGQSARKLFSILQELT